MYLSKTGIAKRITLILLSAMFISVFPGCSAGSKSLPNAEQITLVRCVPDPAALEVFVISKDLTVTQYDFTSCWMDNAFDYFSDPLPPEGEYALTERRITKSAWDRLIEALRQNRFYTLPEKLRPVNGYDFPSYTIQVETESGVYMSGGYGAGYGKGGESRRFRNVLDCMLACVDGEGAAEPVEHKIVGFYFYFPSGSMPDNYYEIERSRNDGFVLKATNHLYYGCFTVGIDEDALAGLQAIIAEHNIEAWHGFDNVAPGAMITTANRRFALSILYDDQTAISACGDHAFPEGYDEAEEALLQFFDNLIESKLDEITAF